MVSRSPSLPFKEILHTSLSIISLSLYFFSSYALVNLPLGDVIGASCSFQPSVTKFLGIPFGQAPVGNLRFRPPIMYNKSYPSPYLEAITVPAPCCQTPQPIEVLPANISEDCLFMNIWAPVDATPESSLPVRVYIHGGNFATSHASEDELDGCNFVAATGIIHINIQYRLGPFGFLSHPITFSESNSTGNWGIMDQQLALKWIQLHISAFGGDPSRVMLFGHSSGAWAVNILSSLSSSFSLFHSAISMSSPGFTSASSRAFALADKEQGYMVTETISAFLNCGYGGTLEQLECFRNASVADLLANAPSNHVIYLSMPINQNFFPVIDDTFINMQVMESIESGNFLNIPYLFGTTKDEGRFSFAIASNATKLTDDDLSDFIDYMYPEVNQSIIVDLYPISKYEIEEYPIYARASDIWTDVFIGCPNYDAMMGLYQYNVPLYGYYMTHAPSCQYLYDVPYLWLGATHGDDIYSVFGQTTNLPPPSGSCNYTMEEVDLSAEFFSGFASMAANGFPSFQNGTSWPKWTPDNPEKTIMDIPVSVGLVDFSVRCEIFNELKEASKSSSISKPNRPVPKLIELMNLQTQNGRFGFK